MDDKIVEVAKDGVNNLDWTNNTQTTPRSFCSAIHAYRTESMTMRAREKWTTLVRIKRDN